MPTVCVAASAPAVTTQSLRTTSLPEDIYIASAMPENISLEEYRLSLQQSNPEVEQSSKDPNRSYFSHYAQDGMPVYVFPYQYDEYGNPLRLLAPEAQLHAQGLPYNQAG